MDYGQTGILGCSEQDRLAKEWLERYFDSPSERGNKKYSRAQM